MARFRGAKYLVCFYCGKTSGLKFNSAIRDFLCLHCDATNYLDQHGEITDPPVATECEAVAVQYAAPQRSSHSQRDDIFCQKCLKNQHLFTKSLAQYLPDDPNDPDYPELERKYYRYRRNLEARYPQVCGDCAEQVQDRIRQAGYTAKTDHLRRMMNLTRGRKTRTRSTLDWINALGKAMWRTGFALQTLWHLMVIVRALQEEEEGAGGGMRDPDTRGTFAMAASTLKPAVDALSRSHRLIDWSIGLGFLAAWWNPHFVQVNRGFTRHILGLTQWYCLQGLIIFFRFISRSLDSSTQAPSRPTARLGAHTAMAAVMLMVYVLAGSCIRVDTTPLFATSTAPLVSNEARPSTQRRLDDSKTFSELVHDALDSAPAALQKPSCGATTSPSPGSSQNHLRQQQITSPFTPAKGITTQQQQQQQPLQYDQEMDWSPTVPQRQSFPPKQPSSPPAPNPIHQEAQNAFWFKVPAAPTAPARRLRNPITTRRLQQDPGEPIPALFSSKVQARPSQQPAVSAGVEFKQPSFFAPQRDPDASSLADLLSQSFTLESDDKPPAHQHVPLPPNRTSSSTPAWAALGVLAMYVVSTTVSVPYGDMAQLLALGVVGFVALRDTGAPVVRVAALSVLELAAACWVAWELWDGGGARVQRYGLGVVAVALGRRVLNAVL